MEVSQNLTVRPVSREDISQLGELLSRGRYVHRHMDWRTPLEWIGHSPYFVLEKEGSINSVLACPPDPTTIGWVRVFASYGSISVNKAWQILWQEVNRYLSRFSISRVAVITTKNWFQKILREYDFSFHQDIIILNWDHMASIPAYDKRSIHIREMIEDDLPRIELLDLLAFEAIWHNSLNALIRAFKQAAYASVITEGEKIIGYQVSTMSLLGGHLARLAIHPDYRSRGLGRALVCDLIQKFGEMGAQRVTVNTQSDNLASLALYEKLGFQQTGERYPVYIYERISV
ncbi:GNAT family N-acetyltransferase [Chloroflexota bacterium]